MWSSILISYLFFLATQKKTCELIFHSITLIFFSFPLIQDEAYWKMKRVNNYPISGSTVKTAPVSQSNFKNNNLPNAYQLIYNTYRYLFSKSFIHTTFTSLFFLFSLPYTDYQKAASNDDLLTFIIFVTAGGLNAKGHLCHKDQKPCVL